ncbi:hypothetical protein MMC22_008656 [Lobaria immixta]|nr:hypothetical protein [Lobaria immixta]
MSATIPSRGLSFSFGASVFKTSAQRGFITFNASIADSPSWNNQTTDGEGAQVPFALEAELVYLPMGDGGVLLLIGGIDNNDWSMIPLSHISVYDIQSKTWYNVTATGDIPGDRSQLCVVVSASMDQSTFQVTIFGGWNAYTQKTYEDVFVLTVPSFRWIKVHDKNDFEDTTDNIGRSAHRCVIYNDAQMIVLGGAVLSGPNPIPCNTDYPPLRVLDTSSYIWKNVFDPSIEYKVPDIVTNVIGGNAIGNANLTEPKGGWDFTALQTIFSQRILISQTAATTTSATTASASTKTSVSTATSPSNADPSASGNKSSPNEPEKHTGAIAGGVAAGVVVLIAALLLYQARASKARRQQSTDQRRDEGTRVELPERNFVQVFEVLNEPPELEPGNRFELSANPVKQPINRFELPGR